MADRMHGCVDARVCGPAGWIYAWTRELMDGRAGQGGGGWESGWMDGWAVSAVAALNPKH
eukprot:366549-Chlamydomonas_euryale.AAC.6